MCRQLVLLVGNSRDDTHHSEPLYTGIMQIMKMVGQMIFFYRSIVK